MKIFIIALLIILTSCNGSGGGQESSTNDPFFTLDSDITAYTWRRPAGDLNGRQMFETVIVLPGSGAIIHYNKDDNGDVLAIRDSVNYFVETTGNNEVTFSDQSNGQVEAVLRFSSYGINQMEICIDSDCNVYDRLASGSL